MSQGWNISLNRQHRLAHTISFIFLTVYPYSASMVGNHPEHVMPFFRKLLLSVWAIHMLDLSHEDLKRSNILASHDIEPILVDFGFAHFTPDGGIVKSLGGTMDYSSPEKLAACSPLRRL